MIFGLKNNIINSPARLPPILKKNTHKRDNAGIYKYLFISFSSLANKVTLYL